MKRRKFLLASGTAVLGFTGANSSLQQPVVALDFVVTAQNSKPENTGSVTIVFDKFQITPRYIDTSKKANVNVIVNIDGEKRNERDTDIDLNNGEKTSLTDIQSIRPITVDGIDSNQDVLSGSVYIEFEHPDISETYRQSFSINEAKPGEYDIPSDVTQQWDTSFSGSGDQNRAKSVTIDSNDNIIVSGFAQFDSDDQDQRVAKYDPTGSKIWSQSYNTGHGFDTANGVATDSNDNIYVVGTDDDYYDNNNWRIEKYDSSGSSVWVKNDYTSSDENEPYDVSVDSDDNIYVVGGVTKSGTNEWAVTKYDKNGNKKWRDLKSTSSQDSATSVDIGNDDTVYVAGSKYDGVRSGYIVEYKPDGTQINSWSYDRGSSSDEMIRGVSSDPTGGFVVAGRTEENSSEDGLVVRYNDDGSKDWVKTYDRSSDHDYFWAVDCDGNGNIYITGYETGSNGNGYLNVLRYNPDSSLQWKKTEGEFGSDIYVSTKGKVYVCGYIGYSKWYVSKYTG